MASGGDDHGLLVVLKVLNLESRRKEMGSDDMPLSATSSTSMPGGSKLQMLASPALLMLLPVGNQNRIQ
jgi:hypothetical protein